MKEKALLFIGIAFILFACSEQSNEEERIKEQKIIDLVARMKLDSTEAKMFLIPTPLQAATVIKNANITYNPSLLLSVDKQEIILSRHKQALSLGMYLTDMGYCLVNDDKQRAMSYVKAAESYLKEVWTITTEKQNLIKRMNNNLQNTDSLFKIALEMYHESVTYLREAGNEDLGLLVIVGCFAEGLHLSQQLNQKAHGDNLKMLMQQQQQYLKSIMSLLDYYVADEEIKKVYISLIKIVDEFTAMYERGDSEAVSAGLSKKVADLRRSVISS